ncbi:MAG: hypothetical protein ABSG75_16390 [Syntrophales bacterium]|jgi:hypothetical protein
MEQGAIVRWTPADERINAAWGNSDDATRDGAYACAIATSELILGLFVMRRAERLTGADYYLAPNDRAAEDLERCFRLEVSGTNLDAAEVRRRLVIKMEQARAGRSNLPALVIVVGFKVKLILLQFIDEIL